jgi:hypothetical protein
MNPKPPRIHFKIAERNGISVLLCGRSCVSAYTEDKTKVTCKFCLKAMET